jgi:hypothetical protein
LKSYGKSCKPVTATHFTFRVNGFHKYLHMRASSTPKSGGFLLSLNLYLHLYLHRCPKLTKHDHTSWCGVRLETTMAEPESPAKSWKPAILLESRWWDLNPRPLDYESSALPLSHIGNIYGLSIAESKMTSRRSPNFFLGRPLPNGPPSPEAFTCVPSNVIIDKPKCDT